MIAWAAFPEAGFTLTQGERAATTAPAPPGAASARSAGRGSSIAMRRCCRDWSIFRPRRSTIPRRCRRRSMCRSPSGSDGWRIRARCRRLRVILRAGAESLIPPNPNQTPFGLSLSKPCPSSPTRKGQPFDRLRANGVLVIRAYSAASRNRSSIDASASQPLDLRQTFLREQMHARDGVGLRHAAEIEVREEALRLVDGPSAPTSGRGSSAACRRPPSCRNPRNRARPPRAASSSFRSSHNP